MKFGGDGVSDDDKLLNFLPARAPLAAMKAAGAPEDYSSASTPLVALIEQLSRRKDSKQVYIKRAGFSLRMARRQPAE